MRNKFVGTVHLPADLYQRLEERALAEERDPLQQARWLIRQALGDHDQPSDRSRELVTTHAGDDRPAA